jgi:photosystem II stability/assembly factor-like uncharacterized protein
VSTASVVGVGLLLIASIVTFESRSGSSPTTTIANHGYPYSVGSPILALKLTHLEMLTSRIGVGVAPIVTYSGALVRAYLVRTNDAGETWTVTGDFPRGFYPWTTAFTTPRGGYVISSGGALFTKDAGRTWSKVVTSYSPLSISINGQVVWIPVEDYCPKVAMNDPCGTFLDSFRIGSLVTTSVSSVPTDQPLLSQVAPTKGYAIGSEDFAGKVYFTTNSGASWRSVATPCEHHQISGSSVVSSSQLLTYCELGPSKDSGFTVLYKTANGGATWHKTSGVQGVGLDAAVGSTGQYLWEFDEGGALSESSDGGREWVDVPRVTYGTNGVIATYGAHEAWHVVSGHGIYRTLNGRVWKLLK